MRESQVMEAYDVSQGPNWHDGLGRSIPADAMASQSVVLIRQEAEQNNLRITSVQADTGRGLETLIHRRDGDIVCGASALFWDEWDGLLAWVKLPGNARFCDRIVQIDKVRRMGQDITVWAVLVGVAQFAQHYVGFRPRANCILEFDPSKGFNNSGAGQAGVSAAALTVKVATRNGAGISAGTPLLLNYGVSFDLSAVTGREASEFKGALDAIFDAQRGRLPVEADDNVAKAREEEKAAKARAAAEAKKKAEEEMHKKRKLEE